MTIKTDISVFNIEDAILSSVYALEQRWRDREEFSYMKKARPNGGLMFVECRNVCFKTATEKIIYAPQKSVVYLPPTCNYSAEFSNPDEVFPATYLVNFTLKDKENTDIILSELPFVICKDHSNIYRDSFCKISKSYMENSLLTCIGELCILLESLIKNLMNEDEDGRDIFTEYILQRLGKELSISSLCCEFAMSESTLRRKFNDLFKVSPLKYINELRIESAKRLLAIPEISIEEICQRLGFYDSAHLNKSFKARYGLTPIQYRRSCFNQLI